MKETIEDMRRKYTGTDKPPSMGRWMRRQLRCLIEKGIVEYCEDCDWLFPKDTDHAEFLNHCTFCLNDYDGYIFVDAHGHDGSVAQVKAPCPVCNKEE